MSLMSLQHPLPELEHSDLAYWCLMLESSEVSNADMFWRMDVSLVTFPAWDALI